MNVFGKIILLIAILIPSSVRAQEKNDFWREYLKGYSLPQPAFKLSYPGATIFFDYSKYGEFKNAGKAGFQYVVKDKEGLKEALGEGIDPNQDVNKDPDYKNLDSQGLLQGSAWDYVGSTDFPKAFFMWTKSWEDPGVKMFFTAQVLENAGLFEQAIKAYYATAVFHPKTVVWGGDHSFFWHVAPVAIASIKRLCRDYPDLHCDIEGAYFEAQNDGDKDFSKHIIKVNPGRIVYKTVDEKIKEIPDLSSIKVVETRGHGKVSIVNYANGHWQMFVDGKPYYIKGISYSPTEVGSGPQTDPNFDARWMFSDKNHNGIIDAPYEAWVENPQNVIGDFQLLKDMGINTIRLYTSNHPSSVYDPALVNKPLLRDMYKRFGIKAIIGDYLGAYTLGSGASWDKGTDYTDTQQKARMLAVVRAKVMDLKDEPFVLMWILGNENNLPATFMGVNASRTNAGLYPKQYAQFINEVAIMIHQIDPNHPVAIGNLELGLLDYYRKYAPAVDIIGINSYRGKAGFDSLFIDARNKFDRPVVIMEYGCDAYTENKGSDEDKQLIYLKGAFRDIVFNKPGGLGAGNAIGGLIFEYLDEWWKASGFPVNQHVTASHPSDDSPDGYFHEEWFGIASQGNGKSSPFERHLRKAYYLFKEMLNKTPSE